MTGFTQVGGINMGSVLAGSNHTVVAIKTGLPCYRGMIEIHNPVIRVMTGITGFNRNNMVHAFAARDRAVVTAHTTANDIGMIHTRVCNRSPCNGTRLMTGITIVGGINMCR